jgi:hypothetical protein
MRNYWLTQDLLQAVGIGFLLLALIGIGLALWLPKKWWGKLLAVLAVGSLISIPLYKATQETRQQQVIADDYKERFTKARELFEERCKTAGEKVYKTVDNVEGILLLNIRRGDVAKNQANPLWEGAALPNDATELGYVENFLVWEHNGGGKSQRGYLNNSPDKSVARGYQFVDVKQLDGSLLRYRLSRAGASELVSEPIKGAAARYAVGFTQAGDPDDRKQWVAGVVITVSDIKTGELLAQRTSYAFEPGLGDTSGGRSPWGFAVSCPAWRGWDSARTRFFVDQVVKPIQEK